MIIVDTALKKREAEGRPIKVGMIGAGFMASGIALQIAKSVPGMVLCGIAARQPQRGIDAFEASRTGETVVRADTAAEISAAIKAGQPVVTTDPGALARAEGLDAIIEATGSMDYALEAVEGALETAKHVILMNAELDGTVGPLLKVKADKAGVVITNVDGDQPGVQMNLFRFVQSIGVKPVLCGNIKGLQDEYRTPDTQRGFAEKWGQNVNMVTSFADGTKIAYEQAIVANGTGMGVAKRGMIGPDPTNKNPTLPLRPLEDFVEMLAPHIDPTGPGIVDFVVGARPGPGVFVLGTHDDPRQAHYLNLYKLGQGPYYLFYTPYHLCHFEVPLTVARAVLFHDGYRANPEYCLKTLKAAADARGYFTIALFLLGVGAVFVGALRHAIGMAWGAKPDEIAPSGAGLIDKIIIIAPLAVLLVLGVWMPSFFRTALDMAAGIVCGGQP